METTFENVALDALIGTPEKYDGQAVRVVGLCSFQFEGNAMWAAPEHLEKFISKNAIWLRVGKNPDLLPFDRQVMVVEGVFTAQNRGHMGMFSGAIDSISKVEPWKG